MYEPGCCVDRRYLARAKADGRDTRGWPEGCTPDTCMTLPDGATCGSCVHVKRCVALFGAKPENTVCDFFPRRFVPRARGGT